MLMRVELKVREVEALPGDLQTLHVEIQPTGVDDAEVRMITRGIPATDLADFLTDMATVMRNGTPEEVDEPSEQEQIDTVPVAPRFAPGPMGAAPRQDDSRIRQQKLDEALADGEITAKQYAERSPK